MNKSKTSNNTGDMKQQTVQTQASDNPSHSRGQLWIVAAPSGGGKTSLVEAAIAKLDNLVRSVSFTTRPRRPSEIDGQDYNFVSSDEFQQLIADNAMLEYELVFGNYYGTSLRFINGYLEQGIDVVLTIDWQGAKKVRELVPECLGVFILPPTLDTLEARLRHRAQDNDDIINARMAEAKRQVERYVDFDYLIINDKFESALDELITCIRANRLERNRQAAKHQALINDLLNSD